MAQVVGDGWRVQAAQRASVRTAKNRLNTGECMAGENGGEARVADEATNEQAIAEVAWRGGGRVWAGVPSTRHRGSGAVVVAKEKRW